MDLIIDVGNSRLTFGYFDNGKLVNTTNATYPRNIAQSGLEMVLERINNDTNINNCIISSVVDEINGALYNAVFNSLHVSPIIINSDFELGIKILSHAPQKIGMDRIANAVAASKMYKKRPLIVVDCGSATTFDIVNEEDTFIGGVIFPGLIMQLRALAANTSKLPEVSLEEIEKVHTVINNETSKAILSGVVNAQAQAIQGLITKCEKELKAKPFIIGTGGDAKFISKYMKYKKFNSINPTLTLEGINMIYELNND